MVELNFTFSFWFIQMAIPIENYLTSNENRTTQAIELCGF